MVDMAISLYRHDHHHMDLPLLDFYIYEESTENYWMVNASVDLAYLVRTGELVPPKDSGYQAFEADLIMRRLECAMLVANAGIFQFKLAGRTILWDVGLNDSTNISCALGTSNQDSDTASSVKDWFIALSQWTWLERATEDVYKSAIMRSDSPMFIFRAFEWLQKGLQVPWKDLGHAVEAPQTNLKNLKKMANSPTSAARHAVESGKRLRLGDDIYAQWGQGALHSIVQARAKVDQQYESWVQQYGNPWGEE